MKNITGIDFLFSNTSDGDNLNNRSYLLFKFIVRNVNNNRQTVEIIHILISNI